MLKILKHIVVRPETPFNEIVTIEMPVRSRVLSVQTQGENVVMWTMQVDRVKGQIERTEKRHFFAAGTGIEFGGPAHINYIGTAQVGVGESCLTYHIFERN